MCGDPEVGHLGGGNQHPATGLLALHILCIAALCGGNRVGPRRRHGDFAVGMWRGKAGLIYGRRAVS